MRIALAGAQCTGKTTFVKDFLEAWPMYKNPSGKHTDLKKNMDLKLNQEGNEESQQAILNFLSDQIMATKKNDKVIFDRSVIDNLVYTMWLNAYGKVSDDFVKRTIETVKNTLIFYDIIFFCPITKHSPITLEDAKHRSTDPQYRTEVDAIFKSLMKSYVEHSETYFPFKHDEGCPALIEIFGNRVERIQLAKFYINNKGEMFGDGDSIMDATSEELAMKDAIKDATKLIKKTKDNTIIPVHKKLKK
jgi:predicted ATPase